MLSNRAAWLKLLFTLFIIGNLIATLLAARFYGGVIRGTDGQMYYAFVRSLVIDHDLDFENEFTALTPHPEQIYEREQTAAGHLANKYPIGTALLIAPWFLLAHGATLLANFLGESSGYGALLPADGYSLLYDRLTGIGICLYALLGAWAAWTFLDQERKRLLPLLIVFALWFGTPAFYYAAVFPLMSHGVGLGLVALALLWSKQCECSNPPDAADDSPSNTYSLLARILFVSTLILLVRPMNAPLLIYPCSVVFSRLTRLSKRQIVLSLLPSACLGFLQLLAWRTVFGEWILYSYQKEPFFWRSPEITNVLFSTTRGLFIWTPLTIFAVLGLLVGFLLSIEVRDDVAHRRVGTLLVAFFATLYISAAWHSWWFGHAFGARQFTEYLPVFALGLLLLWDGLPRLRALWILAGAASLFWTLNLLVLYAYARLPFQGALELKMLTPFWIH